jgi:hypothetical protein
LLFTRTVAADSADKPSGFGFITVANQADADAIMGCHHELQHSQLDVKPALDRAQARNKEEIDRRRKAFVGGLPRNLPDHELHAYFQQFGSIQKCYVVKDPNTGKTRGFGFVIFGTEEGFEAALGKTDHSIKGKEVHLKSAMSKFEVPAESESTQGSASRPRHPQAPGSQHQSKKSHKHKPQALQASVGRTQPARQHQQAKPERGGYQDSQPYWSQGYAAKDYAGYGQSDSFTPPYDYDSAPYPHEDYPDQSAWNGYDQPQWSYGLEYQTPDYYDYQDQDYPDQNFPDQDYHEHDYQDHGYQDRGYQDRGFQDSRSSAKPGPIGGQRVHSNGKALPAYKEEPLAEGEKSSQGYSVPQHTPLIPVQKLHASSLSDRELYLYHAQSAKLASLKQAQFPALNQQSSMQDVYFQREAAPKPDAAFASGSALQLAAKPAPRSAQAIPVSSHVFPGPAGSGGRDRAAPTYTKNPFEEEEEGALQRAEDIYG